MNKLEKFDLELSKSHLDYLYDLIDDNEIENLVVKKYNMILEKFDENEFLKCRNNGDWDYGELIKNVLKCYFYMMYS